MNRHRQARGQALVETVVMLPVLLTFLLGLFYMHDLVFLKMRAIEAARYVNWECVWHMRDTFGGMKSDERLREDLEAIGLGADLVAVNGQFHVRSLEEYESQMQGEGQAPFLPLIDDLFPDMGGAGDVVQSFFDGLESVTQALNPLLTVAGQSAAVADSMVAHTTNWGDEADHSVYTAAVSYKKPPLPFFRKLGNAHVTEFSSLLSHSYNIYREDLPEQTMDDFPWMDDEGAHKELAALIGDPNKLPCDESGHIFDLWLFPSGNLGAGADSSVGDALSVISDIAQGVKCGMIAPLQLLNTIDSALGTDLGFKMPDGTLREYPEKHGD